MAKNACDISTFVAPAPVGAPAPGAAVLEEPRLGLGGRLGAGFGGIVGAVC